MRRPPAQLVLRLLAEHAGVCVRPVLVRRTDRDTGRTEVVEIPCGARLAAKCKPCAERNRRLRIQQIREGWHLDTEPTPPVDRPADEVLDLVRARADLEFDRRRAEMLADFDQVEILDRQIADLDAELADAPLRGNLTPTDRTPKEPRTRSTRRRQDTPDLPRPAMSAHTVGRAYTDADGETRRPSTLLTVTLPGYGAVHTSFRRGSYLVPCECGTRHGERDPLLGTPLDPASYDYRRAALDAIHFAALLDRWWQNLRRAVGWNVQYAGAVELQRRLAPHAHFAVRGTLPRKLWRLVAAATYHQVWWPHFDKPVYTVDRAPEYDKARKSYVDPKTRNPLPDWETALDTIDANPDAEPAYVIRMGRIDPRGINHGDKDTERSIRYVTKYVTKDVTETARADSDPQQAHFDRMHAELSTLPCSPTCANWLLYGVQPKNAKPGLVPGRCKGKVHQPATLGFTGRRVLVSRNWSARTLADIRTDNAAWVRAVLTNYPDAEDQADHHDQADAPNPGEPGNDTPTGDRYYYELARPDDPDVPSYQHRILAAIAARDRWRQHLNRARAQLSATPLPEAAKPSRTGGP
ncbi:replication initiator [Dactylosporangium sucinum]|nr:replication initiator [Dactylosporangium sucinum]